ncbi:MAG: glycosyltransferase family 2 protein [Alphaproteobacteria bacterium]|nr:glycosyltransferase family 2 protein [Alphaproteobacteria bacterium]
MAGGPADSETAPVLSVIIPVYNELQTIGRILIEVAKALPEVPKQIVIVDDRSSDGTSDWLRKNLSQSAGSWRRLSLNAGGGLDLSTDGPHNHAAIWFTVLFHERNRGKGAAVRTGLTRASGDVVVIQDADLEYDPNDWSRMLPLIVERKVADVVYGSRFYGRPHRSLYFHHYLGNRLISFLFNLLYDQMLSDIEVCYKMFTRNVLKELRLTSNGFGVEIEISAQIARARRWRIYEVGISYYGRTYDEGKKVNWTDGAKALVYLFKFRIQLR